MRQRGRESMEGDGGWSDKGIRMKTRKRRWKENKEEG